MGHPARLGLTRLTIGKRHQRVYGPNRDSSGGWSGESMSPSEDGAAGAQGNSDRAVTSSLLALGVGGLFVAFVVALLLITERNSPHPETKLPIILIVGTALMLLVIGALVIVFKRSGLDDPKQALG